MVEKQEYFDSDNESEQTNPIDDVGPKENPERVNTSELSGDLDDLLDEIDQVLESNAEEFVKSYVQKGGQ
ncbi:MAG: ubiquitin-like protein Pup [Actinomycetota bacterium]|nr:ubiquitin-like protein Pup [Actinomycetota bacterium]